MAAAVREYMLSAQNFNSPQLIKSTLVAEQSTNPAAPGEAAPANQQEFAALLQDLAKHEVALGNPDGQENILANSANNKDKVLLLSSVLAQNPREGSPQRQVVVKPATLANLSAELLAEMAEEGAPAAPNVEASPETTANQEALLSSAPSNLTADLAVKWAKQTPGQAAVLLGRGVGAAEIHKNWQDPFRGLEGINLADAEGAEEAAGNTAEEGAAANNLGKSNVRAAENNLSANLATWLAKPEAVVATRAALDLPLAPEGRSPKIKLGPSPATPLSLGAKINQDLAQAMEAKLAKASGAKIYQGLAGGNKVNAANLAAFAAAAETSAASSANNNSSSSLAAAALALGQNMAAADQVSEAAKNYGQHNLLHFILQNQNGINGLGTLSAAPTPVLDLTSLGSMDLPAVMQRIATYLAQHQLAHQESLAVQVLQEDLGKFMVKAQALPNGQIDVSIVTAAGEFFQQHQDAIRSALQDAGVKLNDFKILGQNSLESDLYLAQQGTDGGESSPSEQQQAQDDRARRYRLWQQAYARQEAWWPLWDGRWRPIISVRLKCMPKTAPLKKLIRAT